MPDPSSTSYVIDFKNTLNCATIESAKPGQAISLLVRPENQANGTSIAAEGKRSADGTSFTIAVMIEGSLDRQSWSWSDLKNAIEIHRGKWNY